MAAPAGSAGTQVIKQADKNGDGVLTVEEFAEKDRANFGAIDQNGDGKVDATELDAALKRLQEAKSP